MVFVTSSGPRDTEQQCCITSVPTADVRASNCRVRAEQPLPRRALLQVSVDLVYLPSMFRSESSRDSRGPCMPPCSQTGSSPCDVRVLTACPGPHTRACQPRAPRPASGRLRGRDWEAGVIVPSLASSPGARSLLGSGLCPVPFYLLPSVKRPLTVWLL